MTTALAQHMPTPHRDLAGYLQAVNAFPMLSETEEQSLARRYRDEENLDAAWKLVTSHLRFVVKLSRRFSGYGLPEEDLIQEGNIGLMKAVKKFDPDRGVRLAAFAVHWIKAEIQEYVLRNWRLVKVATTKAQRKLFFNLRSSKKRLGWMSAEETAELADALDVTPEDVTEMEKRMHGYDYAFDGATESDDDDHPFAPAAYLSTDELSPDEVVVEDDWETHTQDRLALALEDLDERSRDIVVRRWVEEPKARLEDLGEKYGVSAERIRQI
ncbi:MAG: RNA polymerase sigma factor RpoH, partial [Pseudomonadota bacterium]